LQTKGYVYSHHVAPHDIEVRELGSGKSRKEQGEALDLYFTVAPKLPVHHGIDAVCNLIPRCWFDQDKCRHGIEALQQYWAEYDGRLRTLRSAPAWGPLPRCRASGTGTSRLRIQPSGWHKIYQGNPCMLLIRREEEFANAL
jgi:hypothetical protein